MILLTVLIHICHVLVSQLKEWEAQERPRLYSFEIDMRAHSSIG